MPFRDIKLDDFSIRRLKMASVLGVQHATPADTVWFCTYCAVYRRRGVMPAVAAWHYLSSSLYSVWLNESLRRGRRDPPNIFRRLTPHFIIIYVYRMPRFSSLLDTLWMCSVLYVYNNFRRRITPRVLRAAPAASTDRRRSRAHVRRCAGTRVEIWAHFTISPLATQALVLRRLVFWIIRKYLAGRFH